MKTAKDLIQELAKDPQRRTGYCGGYICPHRNFRSGGRIYPVLVRIYPILRSDISGACFLCNGQISWRGINTPPPTSGQTSSPTLKSTIRASSDLQLLPIHPSISADLWRIEGGGPDLHLHRVVFHFPLILLRAPLLGFPLGKPSPLCTHLCVFVTDPCCLGAPNPLWVVPQIVVVKAPASVLKEPDSGR